MEEHRQFPLFVQFLEAAWAANVDRRYMKHMTTKYEKRLRKSHPMPADTVLVTEMYDGDWYEDYNQPITGPALDSIRDLAFVLDGGPTDDLAHASNIATYMLGRSTRFKKWRSTIIDRLVTHHSLPPELWGKPGEEVALIKGRPLPPQSLDPGFDYNPDNSSGLIDQYLKGLDIAANPFLTPPDELRTLGFEGEPYTFSA